MPATTFVPLIWKGLDITDKGNQQIFLGQLSDLLSSVLAPSFVTSQIPASVTAMFGPWTAYTATVTSGAGSITTQSSDSAFLQMGKLVFFRMTVVISNIGTASGVMIVSLPAASKAMVSIMFREEGANGQAHALFINAGNSAAQVIRYDNNNPVWANNWTICATGSYEAA